MKRIYAVLAVIPILIFSEKLLSQTDFYLKSGSGAITTPSSWNTQPNGSGTNATNFNGSNRWHFTNRAAGTINGTTFNAPSTATSIIESGFNLTVSGLFGTLSTKIDVAASGTLTVANSFAYNINSFDPASTTIFNSANAQVLGGLYGNIRISTSTKLAGNVTATGTLIIDASRTLSLNALPLSLSGSGASISGTGLIHGDNSSGIGFFNGNGGNNGTLLFTATGNTLNTLYINYGTPGDRIVLGGDVFIENTGLFLTDMGTIDLNGNDLTVDNSSDASFAVTPTDGAIIGDVNSSLIFNGTIGASGGFEMIMSTDNNLKSLVLNSPGSQLLSSAALTINDSLSVLDGAFDTGNLVTIITPAGGPKARVSRVGGSGSIQSDVTVQTVISGGQSGTGWNLLGSPVAGQTVADWDTYATNGGTSGLPMTCVNCFYPPSSLTPSFASIQGWNEASDTYNDQVAASDALTSGTGFWVYVGDGPTNTNDMTLINSGPVLQGIQAFGLSAFGNGWNLMSNPYPSPISWSKTFDQTDGLFSGSIDAEVHVFSPEVGYGTYVANVGGTNGMLDILGIGQGFYVLANPGAVSLVFDEVVKMDDKTTEIWRTSGSKSDNSNREYIKLTINGAYGKDEAMINFNNSATPSFDRLYDGHKIFTSAGYQGYGNQYSQYTTISTRGVDGTDYAINSLPLRTSSLTVPVLARVMVTGSHTISVSDRVNFESCLILHDKLIGKYHDLNAGPYMFDISDTTSAPRFDLIMCQNESGPVMSVNELQKKEQIFINQDATGAFVKTNFEQRTKATISAFNIVGQQLMKDITVDGTETLTHLDLNVSNQVVIIRVTTDNETVVKKIVTH
jgi:hypothetical protein